METNATARRLLAQIGALATELHPGQTAAPTLDSLLDRDLGIDSLGRVELLNRIERAFGLSLPEQAVVEAETPRDLLRAMLGAGDRVAPSGTLERAETVPADTEDLPATARTLVEMLDWHVRVHPARTHLQLLTEDGDGPAISYAGLRTGAEAVAAGLQARGVQPGERVSLMLPTCADYFFSFFGILLAGAVPVPIYPPVRRSQIEDHLRRQRGILANCGAVALVTVAEAKTLAGLLRVQVEGLREVVTAEELRDGGAYEPWVGGGEDTAFLQYTSGSTGNPKGVMLTHANLLANVRGDGQAIAAGGGDVFVSWLPLYHDMGLIGAWLGSLYHGTKLVIMSPLTFLSRPQRWLWALHRHRGTLSAAPNFAYELCLSRIADADLEGLDLSTWRIAFNGAEAVSPDTVTRFGERFARYGFRREAMCPVFGLAECSLGLTFPPPGRGPLIDVVERDTFMRTGQARPVAGERPGRLRFVACGLPLPGHQVRIADASGRELPERSEGRLQFKGPSATSGYFRNPEATAALFQGDWLDSGDLAYMAAGEVYVTGRTRDIVIRAGRNIYPHEIEEALGTVDGIRTGRVAVFGSPDASSGSERLVVLAETRRRDPQAREALRRAVNAMVVDLTGEPADEVVLAPPNTILKTSSGKVRRGACRELYRQGRIGAPRRAPWWQVTRLVLSAGAPVLRRGRQRLARDLFAAWGWGCYGVLAAAVWLGVTLLPRADWRWGLMRAAARALAGLTGTALRVEGLENLPPAGTACVLVANHASYLDAYALVAALPRELAFVAKAELAEGLAGRQFLRRIGAIPVERFDHRRGVEDAAGLADALAAGRQLLVFPEGTFGRAPGLRDFRMGGFVAAARAGAPVLPVAIRGTRSMLRAGTWLPRRGAISVTLGEPVTAADDGDAWTRALGLRLAARDHVLAHCGEPDLARQRFEA